MCLSSCYEGFSNVLWRFWLNVCLFMLNINKQMLISINKQFLQLVICVFILLFCGFLFLHLLNYWCLIVNWSKTPDRQAIWPMRRLHHMVFFLWTNKKRSFRFLPMMPRLSSDSWGPVVKFLLRLPDAQWCALQNKSTK